jgi:NUDIX domain
VAGRAATKTATAITLQLPPGPGLTGALEFPAGTVSLAEAPSDAAHRELEEETGFTWAGCGGLNAGLLHAELGYALRASAGPARTQARHATPANGPQAGQPGAIRQQLGDAAGPRNGDDRPDPTAGQRQPLPRSICRGVVRHATHDHYFLRS